MAKEPMAKPSERTALVAAISEATEADYDLIQIRIAELAQELAALQLAARVIGTRLGKLETKPPAVRRPQQPRAERAAVEERKGSVTANHRIKSRSTCSTRASRSSWRRSNAIAASPPAA